MPGNNIELPADMSRHFEIRRLRTLHWQHTYGHQGTAAERLKMHLNAFGVSISLKGMPEEAAIAKLAITGDTLCPIVDSDEDVDPSSYSLMSAPSSGRNC